MPLTSKRVKTARRACASSFLKNCVCNSTGRSRISSCENKASCISSLVASAGAGGDFRAEETCPARVLNFFFCFSVTFNAGKRPSDFQVCRGKSKQEEK